MLFRSGSGSLARTGGRSLDLGLGAWNWRSSASASALNAVGFMVTPVACNAVVVGCYDA